MNEVIHMPFNKYIIYIKMSKKNIKISRNIFL